MKETLKDMSGSKCRQNSTRRRLEPPPNWTESCYQWWIKNIKTSQNPCFLKSLHICSRIVCLIRRHEQIKDNKKKQKTTSNFHYLPLNFQHQKDLLKNSELSPWLTWPCSGSAWCSWPFAGAKGNEKKKNKPQYPSSPGSEIDAGISGWPFFGWEIFWKSRQIKRTNFTNWEINDAEIKNEWYTSIFVHIYFKSPPKATCFNQTKP